MRISSASLDGLSPASVTSLTTTSIMTAFTVRTRLHLDKQLVHKRSDSDGRERGVQ
jgi:hypothetical protein